MTPADDTTLENISLLFEIEDACNLLITVDELDYSITELKNSASGSDNIHNQMLCDLPLKSRKALLTSFNDIWNSGIYPSQWKISTIIPILKPNKNKKEIRSYRPIALTSCLGKLYEHIINHRLVWKLENDSSFHPSQCGFRPKSSTTEALLKITEHCHESLHNKQYAIVVALDLEGAFDKVWWEGVVLKASSLGIKGRLLKFINSFLQNRSIQVKIKNSISNKFSISMGTPQGAVISPSLFNIMMSDFHESVSNLCSPSTYADDCSIVATGPDLEILVREINSSLAKIHQWANNWKLSISQSKSLYTVVTRKRSHKVPLADLEIMINGQRIRYDAAPKILGICLDKTLTWKDHINQVISQCTQRLNLMKVLASKTWGADFTTLRMFYLTYIRSKIDYALEIWSSCSKSQFNRVCKIQNSALRLITGALRTTSIASMEIETGILPLNIHKDTIVLNHRLKSHFMDRRSPRYIFKHSAPKSFFQRSTQLLTDYNISLSEHEEDDNTICSPDSNTDIIPVVNPVSPWNWKPPLSNVSIEDVSKSTTPTSILLQATLQTINENFSDHYAIYTDGSLNPESGSAGAGVYLEYSKEEIIIPLPPCSILAAELVAIDRALQEIATSEQSLKPIVIFTDSKSSIQSLLSYKPSSYFQLTSSIMTRLASISSNVFFQWIPSHVGLPGNEHADLLAKTASLSGPVNRPSIELPSLICKVRNNSTKRWRTQWQNDSLGRNYYEIQQKPNDSYYKNMNRAGQVIISQVRLGHFPCRAYLKRFGLEEDQSCRLCDGVEESLEHILIYCPALRRANNNQTLVEMLGNKNGGWCEVLTIMSEWKRRCHAMAS